MYSTSLKNKIWLGLCFGLVVGATFLRLSTKYFSPWIPPPFLLGITVLFLIAALILPFVWHSMEKEKGINGSDLKTRLEHRIIYAMSLDLIMFGFHKIEGLQMIVPLGILDTPFSSLSGETLVWAFFKYSYPFTVFIALLQILTAVLLLFSRTRLFGLILAVPMLVFITCLDIFYQMPLGPLSHGIILLLGVFYFLSQDSKRLIDFIFQPLQGTKSVNIPNYYKNIYRVSLFIWPLFFHFIYNYPDKHPQLTGKYQVQNLKIDNVALKAKSPKDSVLTTVYMDLEDEIAFDFNDWRYRYIGTYFLNEKNDSIRIRWRYPSDKLDNFKGKLIRRNDQMFLKGKMNGETLEMQLNK
ncbi:hypothetical protein CLU81_1698 [Flavobacterium sp. 9]|uniref:hypothetical protein n=1 Tax=Flavobacterium sp. 9 TaxID=2035198 RepID=UPI000C19240B|nr:hypothetical protein [Flavobacterium sp. 9]PIF31213.1 hypothetical protein CLU81_1698 [Flavobacterium sp. 9]